MKSRINDRICSIIFLIFGCFLFFSIPANVKATKFDPLGSRFFPYAIALCIIGIALWMLIGTFVSGKYKKLDQKEKKFDLCIPDNLRALIFCGVLFLGVFLIEKVHFLLGASVIVLVMLLLCRVKKPLWYLIVLACTFAAYFVFTNYFNVRL